MVLTTSEIDGWVGRFGWSFWMVLGVVFDGFGMVLTISETDVRESRRSVSGKGGSWVVSETDLRVLRGKVSENGVFGRFRRRTYGKQEGPSLGMGGAPPPGGVPGSKMVQNGSKMTFLGVS